MIDTAITFAFITGVVCIALALGDWVADRPLGKEYDRD